ncbi:hypothetical protein K502DRAFT_325212 [Neoconidiobolus thromboides FSU 785]|nr:hypothetical protein K502DRAFT_325212 [Neoconidiobolus thromboides FSU 785]
MLKISTISLLLIQCFSNQNTIQSSNNVQLPHVKKDSNLVLFMKGLKSINNTFIYEKPVINLVL